MPSSCSVPRVVCTTYADYGRPNQETGPGPAFLSFPFDVSLRFLIWGINA